MYDKKHVRRVHHYSKLYKTDHLQVIAEMKRASPSKGLIAEGMTLGCTGNFLHNAGAACISVLTDSHFFKGSFEDLAAVADNVPIPLLCKDLSSILYRLTGQKGWSPVILLIAAALTEDLTR